MNKKGTFDELADNISKLSVKINNAESELMTDKIEKGVELSDSRRDALFEALIYARKERDTSKEEVIINEMSALEIEREEIEREFVKKLINKNVKDLFSF